MFFVRLPKHYRGPRILAIADRNTELGTQSIGLGTSSSRVAEKSELFKIYQLEGAVPPP